MNYAISLSTAICCKCGDEVPAYEMSADSVGHCEPCAAELRADRKRINLLANLRNHLRSLETELGRIATMGDDESAAALHSLAASLRAEAVSADDLAANHESELAETFDSWTEDDEDTEPGKAWFDR